MSEEGVFGVKFFLTAREKRCRGFVDFCVGICSEVSIKRSGVAEIGEVSVISVVSSCISSLSKGISGFPGLGVAGAIPGLFSGKSDNLRVRTAKKALCLEGTCGVVRAYLITLQLSSIAAFTSL